MTKETVERSIKIMVLINFLQEEIDELAREKSYFRHELKMTGKLFLKELEKQVQIFYAGVGEKGEEYYNTWMIEFEKALTAFMNDRVV